jgi:hypothetical protein
MRRIDMLKHARECRQWAGTARTEQAKEELLEAAGTWDLLAKQPDIDDTSDNQATNGASPLAPATGLFRRFA